MARANAGTLVEVDKTKQLLFFVIDGKTAWILNTSTGNGEEYTEEDKNTPGEVITGVSLTPSGLHKVNRERPEGWWEGDLGEIYRPKYFRGGVAVHGSNSIPNYPASHGCVRVSVPAMDFIWDSGIMPMGTPVWVHEASEPTAPRPPTSAILLTRSSGSSLMLPSIGAVRPWADPHVVSLAGSTCGRRRLGDRGRSWRRSLDGRWAFRLFDSPDAVTAAAVDRPATAAAGRR